MTPNQTIDGVPRADLEAALKADASRGATASELVAGWAAMERLRALLEARHPSEDELIASGLGYPFSKEEAVQLWYSGFKTEPITVLEAWDAIGHDIGCNPSKDELLDSLRNMAAICEAHGNDMPAAQPQGDPVALLSKGFTTLETRDGKYRIITQYKNRDDAWSDYKALCKAQQPAPAAFPGYPPVPEDRKIPESPPAPEVEEPITLEAVGITREGDDGIYIEWTLEGGLAALETAGLVLFASPEGNDMCAEDGSCEVYLAPVDLDATEQRGYLRGLNQASIGTCDVPPPGWVCSRGKGHEGPCAASQAPVQQKKENFTYSSNQATNCAGCSNHKHTPLRVDAMGGYVCLTCIYNELDRLLIEESARHAEPDWQGCQEISDLPRVHEVLQAFSADPTEDNGIAVVQAIVQATTRKTTE